MTSATAESSGKLTCCLRRSPEWAERFEFTRFFIDTWHVDRIATVWGDTFNMPYIDFRRRLRSIQDDNLADVGFDQVVNLYDFDPKQNNGWVVPTDDDDWFHPDLRTRLFREPYLLLYWNFCNYTEGRVLIQQSPKERVRFESNNYAAFCPTDDSLLSDHAVTNAALRGKVITHLPAVLSIHNRSLASLGLLSSHGSQLPQSLPELYRLYQQDPQIDADVPSYFLPYIERMQRIYHDELKLKGKFK